MSNALVTGANRGLGYEYVRQLLERGWHVIACTRKPDAPALQELSGRFAERLDIRVLDVTDHAAVDALAAELESIRLDLLVNNAGTTGPKGTPECMEYQALDNMDYAIWRDILEVNVLGLFKVATAFHPHLASGGRGLLVNLSSDLGSNAQNTRGNLYSYRVSKAAVNMISKGIGNDWHDIVCVAMAPGWCKTDLGGSGAEIAPEDSVAAQLDTFARLGAEDSGRYIDRHGETVPY